MNNSVDFALPLALLLLPLALLPLLQNRRDTLQFSHLAWLPTDRAGKLLAFVWRACALLAIASSAQARHTYASSFPARSVGSQAR